MFLKTHSALLPNCLLLAAELFFVVLMVTGIYKHNPGIRAFKIMYREVRPFLPRRAIHLKQVIFHHRACCGL